MALVPEVVYPFYSMPVSYKISKVQQASGGKVTVLLSG